MPVAVVKLGSSIVAEDSGELRAVRGRADRRRGRRAAPHAATTSWSSPAARSPAGCTCSAWARGPAAIEDLQAASAVGQGRLYRAYDELLRERGIQSAQVLLTFFDMSARTHYLNARRTLRRLLDWRVVPVINENDTTTTDEISFGDNDFLAAQVAMLVARRPARAADRHRGRLHRRSARRRGRASSWPRSPTSRRCRTLQIGHAPSPLGSGGMRSKVVAAEMATAAGIAAVIGSGLVPGVLGARAGRRAGRHALRPAPVAPLELQAVAEVRQAQPRDAGRRRGRRAGAARGRHEPAAGRHRRGRGAFDAGDAVEVRDRRLADRQGHLQLLGRRAAPGDGPEVGAGARGAAAGDRGGRAPGLLRPG